MEDQLKKGEELFSGGRIKEAQSCFEAVIHESPQNMEAYNNLGVIAYQEGEIGKAFGLFSKALDIDPFYREGLLNFSHVLRKLDQLHQIVPFLERVLRRYPDDKVWLNLLKEAQSVKKEERDEKGTGASGAVQTKGKEEKIIPSGLRVLHGTMEIANQMNTYTSGLRGLHVFAKTVCYYPNYLGYDSDYILNVSSFKDIHEANRKTRDLASRLIPQFDVFHFHYGTSLTLDRSDLKVLKEMKKKVFMNYWGSEVRTYDKAVRLNPYIHVKFQESEEAIKRGLEYASTYISDCVVSDHEMVEYVKDFYERVHFIPQAINLKQYEVGDSPNDPSRPMIVHAPTDPVAKGSPYILKALDQLRERYDFDLILVQNKSHEEAKRIYQKADIVIDSILDGAYGLLALEAMAMGKPVVGWICDYMRERYPIELPIVSANPQTIQEKIEPLLRDDSLRKEIGIRGKRYVEKYHDMSKVACQLLQLYQKE